METLLEGYGFTTSTYIDQSVGDFDLRLSEFLQTLTDAQARGSTVDAVFYYAGHGIAHEGTNYLIPVDFSGENLTVMTLRRRGVSLDDTLAAISGVADRTIFILDSCRDDPYEGLPLVERGIGTPSYAMPRDVAVGTIILFCAGLRQRAKDFLPSDPDDEKNGVCTRFILDVLAEQPRSFEEAANEIQLRVSEATAPFSTPPQTPAIYDQMIGSYLFAPDTQAVIAATDLTRRGADIIAQNDVSVARLDNFSTTMRGATEYIAMAPDVPALPILEQALAGISVGLFFDPERLAAARELAEALGGAGALVNLVPTVPNLADGKAPPAAGTTLLHVADLTDGEKKALDALSSATKAVFPDAAIMPVPGLQNGPFQIQLF